MRRHRRFRYGPPIVRPWRPFGGLWVILLAMLFFGIRFWPIILIVIVLGALFSIGMRGAMSQTPPPPPMPFPPQPAPRADSAPIHRVDLLPTHCPNCGGPVRSSDVKWAGSQSAACSYCGANLPMRK